MDLKSLADVELRDATFPLSRSAPSNFLPALRTPVILRELVALGVLDPGLSKVIVQNGRVVGCCLVEVGAQGAYISGLGTDALSQQRGGSRALIEAVIAAGKQAQLGRLSVEVSEADAGPQGLWQAVGFVPLRTRLRMALLGTPNRALLPDPDDRACMAATRISAVPCGDALGFLQHHGPSLLGAAVSPAVLGKLEKRLSAAAMLVGSAIEAVVIVDKERKLLVALAGDPAYLPQLAVYAAARLSAAYVDSLADDDPAVEALESAGFSRIAVRTELSLSLPNASA